MIKRQCPNCGGKLEVTRLMCSDCRAEYPIAEGLSPYDYLNNNQLSFLETFLRCKGNLKSVGEMLNISYPTVKKRFDDLLVSLGYAEESSHEEDFYMPSLSSINIVGNSASQVIKRKLYEAGGEATISLLDGKPCRIVFADDENSFISDKLVDYKLKYNFSVFDYIVELLKNSPNNKAPKGNAHGREDKVGFGKCTEDTVVGTIAIRYFGKKAGESTYDPVFVMAAMLEWAGIAHNLRGYIQLADTRFAE
jgi:hypothetical protein